MTLFIDIFGCGIIVQLFCIDAVYLANVTYRLKLRWQYRDIWKVERIKTFEAMKEAKL